MPQCTVRTSVAVIGAGPGGLVAARWLAAEGFDVHVFEQGRSLGGQWAGVAGTSGVWPALYTNTSRILTAFSDLPHDGEQTFLSAPEILRYLHRYAEMFAVDGRIRLRNTVIHVKHDGRGWSVETDDGAETFDRVVIASGRFQTPALPSVPGLSTFAGSKVCSPPSTTAVWNRTAGSASWSAAARSALWRWPPSSCTAERPR